MKKLPTDAIKLWTPEKHLSVSEADLLARSYRAGVPSDKGMVIVTTMPSAQHPEFVHYEVMALRSGEWWASKSPIYPSYLGDFLHGVLAPLNVDVESLPWRACDASAPDSPKVPATAPDAECVYFLTAGPFMKIGKATGHPAARIRELQTGCPYPITLVAHIPGGISEEFALHKRFASYRAHGEWFRHEGDLAEFVRTLEVRA